MSRAPEPRSTLPVLGTPIDVITPEGAVARIAAWAAAGESRVVCACNVHAVVTATQQHGLRDALAAADLATPDGAPVAWLMRRLMNRSMRGRASTAHLRDGASAARATPQQRVSGPDLMLAYLEHAARHGEPVYLYGSSEDTLAQLRQRLHERWPALAIAGWRSPPFRPATAEEDAADVAAINASGARTVWVSLGCPKQELWMHAHRGRVQAVMLGVGAAFDFHAGTRARAPRWMREHGLEWLHRLASEPARLWRRYLVTNTLFVAKAARQWLRG